MMGVGSKGSALPDALSVSSSTLSGCPEFNYGYDRPSFKGVSTLD